MDFIRRIADFFASPAFPWKNVIVGLSVGKFLFESFITLRQCRALCTPQPPPSALQKRISTDTFAQTERYGLAKARFGLARGLWYTAVGYLYLRHDVLASLWHLSGRLLVQWAPASWGGSACQSAVFAVLYLAANMAESIPPQLYNTFVLEQRFGFNKQSVAGFFGDQVKTFLISSTFLIVAVVGFLYVNRIAADGGGMLALYLGLAALGLRVFLVTFYPVFILPLFFKLSPLQGKDIQDRIIGLADRLAFPLSKVHVADGSSRSTHSNAFFFGFPWQKNIVVFDTLIQEMSPAEVTVVVAHELGHWKLGHTAWLFALQQLDLVYSFGLFSLVYANPHFYAAFGLVRERPAVVGFLLFCQALPPVASAHQLLSNVFSRRYEYEADAFARGLGLRAELAAALVKLNVNNLSTVTADSVYSAYHHSHPLLAERLAALDHAKLS
ncbi:hypothetical protein LMH87_009908 [Akanthomyces muscarius]|uniref:CAAX prenyl protease n=1 Tax=Akanthomyces muscarius TaxID=2231603 RepID=A0A9W8QCS6_AKAMU|nr:hypothetical protein LMH87_009908 [Akanthomyces muscarius]KAJ4153421.1 hypothetical protein LMH87_009908 [Akanthomyces muscarius]